MTLVQEHIPLRIALLNTTSWAWSGRAGNWPATTLVAPARPRLVKLRSIRVAVSGPRRRRKWVRDRAARAVEDLR